MTNNPRVRERSVIKSSVSPSTRKSALRRSYDPKDPAEVNQPLLSWLSPPIFLKVSAIHKASVPRLPLIHPTGGAPADRHGA